MEKKLIEKCFACGKNIKLKSGYAYYPFGKNKYRHLKCVNKIIDGKK